MRGLKSLRLVMHGVPEKVALFVSAWIEIFCLQKKRRNYEVALFVSAWIEIAGNNPNRTERRMSHSL